MSKFVNPGIYIAEVPDPMPMQHYIGEDVRDLMWRDEKPGGLSKEEIFGFIKRRALDFFVENQGEQATAELSRKIEDRLNHFWADLYSAGFLKELFASQVRIHVDTPFYREEEEAAIRGLLKPVAQSLGVEWPEKEAEGADSTDEVEPRDKSSDRPQKVGSDSIPCPHPDRLGLWRHVDGSLCEVSWSEKAALWKFLYNYVDDSMSAAHMTEDEWGGFRPEFWEKIEPYRSRCKIVDVGWDPEGW